MHVWYIFFLHTSNTKEGVAIKLWDQEMKRCRTLSLGPGPCVVRSVCRGKVSPDPSPPQHRHSTPLCNFKALRLGMKCMKCLDVDLIANATSKAK